MIGTKTEWINYLITQGKDNVRYKITEYRPVRTNEQNKYLHAIFAFIAKYWETWHTAEEIKDLLKEKFLSEYSPVFDCSKPKRTRDLTTKEMTEFIEKIRVFCADFLSLEIPNAEDKRFIDFYNDYYF